MNRLIWAVSCLLAVGCRFYDKEQSLLVDPYFNSWCGESLCHWETEQGSIRRAATWDEADHGVELVSTPTIISRDIDMTYRDSWFDERPGFECLRFTVLGDVRAEAEVTLELDFMSDGVIDYESAVPGLEWQRIEVLVRLPNAPLGSMEMSLHKHGIGTATFAILDVVGTWDCLGNPIEIKPRKPGALCYANEDCAGGLCLPTESGQSTCAECIDTTDCPAFLVCGLREGLNSVSPVQACVAPRGTPTGSICDTDEQCATVKCVSGRCGECRADEDCADGSLCGAATTLGGLRVRACVLPGGDTVGAPCEADAECASGNCDFVCSEP